MIHLPINIKIISFNALNAIAKVGETNFVKMYSDRIVEGTIVFSKYHRVIKCTN